MKLALFGSHIEHSLSPKIHQDFARQFNVQMDYQKISVQNTHELDLAWKNFINNGGQGANITAPFKRYAIKFCTCLSEAAQQAQSINTIKMISSSTFYGDNTDGLGFLTDFKKSYQHSLTTQKILLLGAGGAAAGILAALNNAISEKIMVANRTLENAKILAAKYKNVQACLLEDIPHEKFDIVINTATQLSFKNLNIHFAEKAIAYDIRYGESAKDFIHYAKNSGVEIISDGYGMVLEQAALAFQVWFNLKPNTKNIR